MDGISLAGVDRLFFYLALAVAGTGKAAYTFRNDSVIAGGQHTEVSNTRKPL
jgi:hypothetical protein